MINSVLPKSRPGPRALCACGAEESNGIGPADRPGDKASIHVKQCSLLSKSDLRNAANAPPLLN